MVNDNHPWAKQKLTSQQRAEIHERYQDGENSWDLAKEFGVTSSLIRMYGGTLRPGHSGGQGYTSSGIWREKETT